MFGKQDLVGKVDSKFYDNYKVLKKIGSGSYGTVYRVQHLNTQAIYACKQMKKLSISDMDKFTLETSIMKKMDHPNIIKLFEIYEEEQYIYLIMEECTGGELFERIISRIEDNKLFTEKEAAIMFKQLVSAVCYCHKQGICHRDLKPENMLFLNSDEDSPIKVIDFGLSRSFTEKGGMIAEKEGSMKTKVGTAYYVSPEVLKGKYDEKCDVWSCGVILYIILSGDPPFNGANDNDIYRKIQQKKFSFPSKKWSKISQDAKDLITSMLSDPGSRPTAEEVLATAWVNDLAPNSADTILSFDVQSLKEYRYKTKFQKLVLTFIASRLRDDEIQNLKDIFVALDANQDGTLTLKEIQQGLSKIENCDIDVEDVFESIDTDKSGVINYTEFLAATIDKNLYQQEEKLSQAFKMLDKDSSEKISLKEMMEALNLENEDDIKELEESIVKFDINKDGEIDFKEFCAMMGFKK